MSSTNTIDTATKQLNSVLRDIGIEKATKFEVASIMKKLDQMTETVIIVNTSALSVGLLTMDKDRAQKFHEMVNEFINNDENRMDIVASNISNDMAIQVIRRLK